MAPHPGIDTDQIKENARKDLLGLLEGVRGKKNLVIEQSLAGPVGILVKFSTLQDYGVDKVFFLENKNVDSSQKNIVFLIGGEKPSVCVAVAEQIKQIRANSSVEHDLSIIWVPRRTLVSDKILEDAGVLGDVSVEEFSLRFLPLEQDVLTLAFEDPFGDIYLRKDPTSIYLAAQALMPLQKKYGLFPRILGKGDNARRLMELLIRMRAEHAAEENASMSELGLLPSAVIESLIVIDRGIDMATPLLTQLTYEGLIDETFGIKNNQAEVDTSIVGQAPAQAQRNPSAPPQQQSFKRKIQLDSSDKLYDQLRDANFAIVGPLLNKVARRLAGEYESHHSAKSTSELRDFVNKLPGYQAEQQSLKIHTSVTEEVMKNTQSDIFSRVLEVQQNLVSGSDPSTQHNTIEELIARDTPLTTVLRLLCLESCVSGGIRPKDLDNLKRQILHAYGYQHLLTLDALEKMQLLVPRTSANPFFLPVGGGGGGVGGGGGGAADAKATNYNHLRKALRLIVDEVNEQDPNDIAYVYSGYAPLSVRLVQAVIQKQHLIALTRGSAAATNGSGTSSAAHGWQGFEDVLRNVKGETFNKVQKGEEAAMKARHLLAGSGKEKTVVVMFVGGVTFTEIAALRFVARSFEGRRKLLICTTGIIGGRAMVGAAIEKRDFGKK
ncbi:MAG: hypothetical protein LQ342_002595 [Letrouitia transgressa]|nr:MAG: hypothetical protein LQ342_002595 [Letrouitia transgressa]